MAQDGVTEARNRDSLVSCSWDRSEQKDVESWGVYRIGKEVEFRDPAVTNSQFYPRVRGEIIAISVGVKCYNGKKFTAFEILTGRQIFFKKECDLIPVAEGRQIFPRANMPNGRLPKEYRRIISGAYGKPRRIPVVNHTGRIVGWEWAKPSEKSEYFVFFS